ncbi:G2/mitotic-specific cyclin C13-1-like [Gastrolobium bilobum]|uniref:G2/mitotic-specific cyclin C13-1-like n=1 Tax=Gastrolobium bilobum TaxID=150636 RepID=UPI002AB25F3C|nr:G2/mitotic-specific cyclin C13-1-like [Gastrolobium bilobum]
MDTRASKKRANARTLVSDENQQPKCKKPRVVLGELTSVPNFIDLTTSNPRIKRVQCPKNPRIKKSAATKRAVSLSEKDVPQSSEPFESDIYQYLRTMEMEKKRRPLIDYIERVQKEVNANRRGILVDWLVEVAEEYNLLPDTLHLSVSYIDRFLSINPMTKPRLQLLGVSSLLVASKYEEINPPSVEDFCDITDNTYKKTEVVKMEADILKSLNFEMGNPTVMTFIRRFAGIAGENQNTLNSLIEFLGYYLAELSLLDYDCIRFLPSIVAASAIFLARYIIFWPEVHPWTSSLCECSGYKSVELKECVLILHDLYLSKRAASFKAVRDKYEQDKYKYVANVISPPKIPSNYFEEV